MSLGTRVMSAASPMSWLRVCGGRVLSTTSTAEAMRKPRWTGPPVPKRPGSAYFLFFKERFPDIKVELENQSGSKLSQEKARIAGAMWNELSTEEKKPYQDMFVEAVEAYHESLQKFKDDLSADDYKRLMKFKNKLKKYRQRQKDLQSGVLVEKPRPKTAYQLFVQNFYKTRDSSLTPNDVLKRCAEEWQELAEDEKEKLQEKAKQISSKEMEDYYAARSVLPKD